MSSSFCKHVGHWRVSKEVIGTGTTSTVMLATHAKLPTLCAAVKIVSRSGLLMKADGDPNALYLADAVIHREVLLMKLAAHQRVVKIYDFVGHGDLVYMVLEHAPNKTLFDLFRASTSYLPSPLVTHIFSQVMQGLAYLHALRIVHRDMKLENVFVFGPDVKALLCETTTVEFSTLSIKIGDFGLSHIDDPEVLSTVFHGSPHYQAPELWARVPHRSFPTDIWSAGVILYALQCRHLPFDLTALDECATVFLSDHDLGLDCDDQAAVPAHRSPEYMAYDVPESMSELADRLLQRLFTLDPAKRPTAREVLNDPYFEGLPVPMEEQDPDHTSPFEITHHTDLYDIATLSVPPTRHTPRESFVGSTLELDVKDSLASRGDVIEKRWARRLRAYIADNEAWEAALAMQVEAKEVRTWSKNLGNKLKSAEALVHREMSLGLLKPKLTTSLSFRSLRVKTTETKLESHSHPTTPRPSPASSSVAEALQDRRECLLRCAYELGFGTGDLRVFADEADKIVRVAREGRTGMRLEEIVQEIERCSVYEQPSPVAFVLNKPVCTSTVTLVSNNDTQGGSGKGTLGSIPVVRLLDMEL